MRITLNELRRIIREALGEYTPEEISELDQAEKIYSGLIIQAMKNASEARMRILGDPNIPAQEKPELIRSAHELEMLAVDNELLKRAKHSKQDIMKYTEDKTRREIERRKAAQGKVIGEAMISDLGPGGMVIINQERPDSFVIKIREQGAPRSLGHIRLTRRRVDEGSIWEVEDVQAKRGWGPLLYDLAMEYVSSDLGDLGITPDSSQVSGDARNVWSFYFENRGDRGDVEKEPLPLWKWPHSAERPEYLRHYYYKIDRTFLNKFEASGALKFVQE